MEGRGRRRSGCLSSSSCVLSLPIELSLRAPPASRIPLADFFREPTGDPRWLGYLQGISEGGIDRCGSITGGSCSPPCRWGCRVRRPMPASCGAVQERQEPKECGEDGLREDAGRHAGRAVRADQRPDHGQGHDLRRRSSPSCTCRTATGRRPTSSSASTRSRATWPATRTSGPPPAGSPTGSPRRKFTLDGKEYKLAANNGPNTLHGGLKGFDKVVWKAEDVSGPDGPAVKLTYLSPDGEEGFPGNLSVDRDLHRDARRRAQDRLRGHDRQGDAGQPHQPQLLQPRRAGLGDDPGPRADARGRPVHARRRRR